MPPSVAPFETTQAMNATSIASDSISQTTTRDEDDEPVLGPRKQLLDPREPAERVGEVPAVARAKDDVEPLGELRLVEPARDVVAAERPGGALPLVVHRRDSCPDGTPG